MVHLRSGMVHSYFFLNEADLYIDVELPPKEIDK